MHRGNLTAVLMIAAAAAASPLFARGRAALHPAETFNYGEVLAGTNPLSIDVTIGSDGRVTVTGADHRRPTTPFRFTWGDGSVTSGFFPQSHAYADRTRNYLLSVQSTVGSTVSTRTSVVRYADSPVVRAALPADVPVTMPTVVPPMVTRRGGVPSSLAALTEHAFGVTSNDTVASVLWAAAAVEVSFASGDVYRSNGQFAEVVLTDPNSGGASYSIWYTTPVALAASSSIQGATVGYSSFFHEMGHNVTLNMPQTYSYGGRIDGPANAIYSEAMAQIFQHATAYELANNQIAGLPADLILDIENSAHASAGLIVQRYDHYVASGKHFASWNDPSTADDETFDTFMTIAYEFLRHAEASHNGYRQPVTRMCSVLRAFNPVWQARYSPSVNSAAAESFRATLMVAALSYAFEQDLRSEFRALNFPIDDATYNEVLEAAVK